MVSLAKELLIQSPIGRIKWTQAPNDYTEILDNLSRTFRVGKSGIRLRDQYSADVTAFNYDSWANSADNLELILTVDYSAPLETQDPLENFMLKSNEISDLKNKAMMRAREIGEKSVSPDPPQRGTRGKKVAPRARISEEEQKMIQGLDILMNSCGFTDEAKCRDALKKSNYDPQQAINLLFA